MSRAIVAVCTLKLYLHDSFSLKDKRSVLKSMLARLRSAFNVSAAEVGLNDQWQSALIAVVTVSNSGAHARQSIQAVIQWLERHYPEAEILQEEIEVL